MTEFEEEISIDELEFLAHEKELAALFLDDEANETMNELGTKGNEERIDRILKRVRAETVVSDSANFIFESFGKGLSGVTDAVMSVIEKRSPKNDSF